MGDQLSERQRTVVRWRSCVLRNGVEVPDAAVARQAGEPPVRDQSYQPNLDLSGPRRAAQQATCVCQPVVRQEATRVDGQQVLVLLDRLLIAPQTGELRCVGASIARA